MTTVTSAIKQLQGYGNNSADVNKDCGEQKTNIPDYRINFCFPDEVLGDVGMLYLWNRAYPLNIDFSGTEEQLIQGFIQELTDRASNNDNAPDKIREVPVSMGKDDPTTETYEETNCLPARTVITGFSLSGTLRDNNNVNYNKFLPRAEEGFLCRAIYVTKTHIYGLLNGGINALVDNGRYSIQKGVRNKQEISIRLSWTASVSPKRMDSPLDMCSFVSTQASQGNWNAISYYDSILTGLMQMITINSGQEGSNVLELIISGGVNINSMSINMGRDNIYTSIDSTEITALNTAVSNGNSNVDIDIPFTIQPDDIITIRYEIPDADAPYYTDQFNV